MQFNHIVPDGEHYDVIVCGAGPGGTAAALAAARLGKKVLLVDHAGCVGGYWTSGLIGISLDMPGKGGIPRKILDKLLLNHCAQWVDSDSYTYDIEAMKHLLEQLLLDAGVDVLLYTRITDVIMQNRRIAAVLAEGPQAFGFTADWFIDGTGHGDLSALAGCNWEMGMSETGPLQPASLEALVIGVPPFWKSDIHNRQRKQELFKLFLEAGVTCSYPNPLLFKLSPNNETHILAINHQYGVDIRDSFGISRATIEARSEIYKAVSLFRKLPGWENLSIVTTAEQLGLRDSRRVKGLYQLKVDDALNGSHFEDGVVPVHFCFDVHALSKKHAESNQDIGAGKQSKPFQVPLRSLIPMDVDNLWLVGRCISGDFLTHSIYRTTCTAAGTGEAVAVALAMIGSGKTSHDADGCLVSIEMKKRGYILDYIVQKAEI